MKHIITIFFLCLITLNADEKRDDKTVNELFKVMKMESTFQQTLEKMLDVQIKQNPAIAPMKDTMLEFFEKYMGWESMKPDMAKIYMKNFSDEELKAMISFYKTPVGKKAARLLPVLSSEGAALGQKRVQENITELQSMIQKKMQELNK